MHKYMKGAALLAAALAILSAGPAAAQGRATKGASTKFGQGYPTRGESGNAKITVAGTCVLPDLPADLDLRTCNLQLRDVLSRVTRDTPVAGELVRDGFGTIVTDPGVLQSECTCADPASCNPCDQSMDNCFSPCRGSKSNEATYKSNQRLRPVMSTKVKRRSVNGVPQIDFSMTVDRAIDCPSSIEGCYDAGSGVAFPPAGGACLENRIELACAGRPPIACSTTADWRQVAPKPTAQYTQIKTVGAACEGGVCYANAECPLGYYCGKAAGACGAAGQCFPRDGDCPQVYDPVCGCDGQSYANEGCARAAGANVTHPGPCL